MTQLETELATLEIEADFEFSDEGGPEIVKATGEGSESIHGGRQRLTSTEDRRVTLYRTDDGMPVPVAEKRAAWTLANKKFPDGRRMFSVRPTVEFKLGSNLCPLHPKHPENHMLKAAGITRECRKNTLRTAMDARLHFEHRHGNDFKAWREYQAEQTAAENRDFQRQQLAAMERMAAPQSRVQTFSATPVATANEAAEIATEPQTCECGWVNERGTPQGMSIHTRLHCPLREGKDD